MSIVAQFLLLFLATHIVQRFFSISFTRNMVHSNCGFERKGHLVKLWTYLMRNCFLHTVKTKAQISAVIMQLIRVFVFSTLISTIPLLSEYLVHLSNLAI